MFGIGTTEFLVIIVVAILVLGPEHLPKIMRTVQKTMSDFRRISTEFQRTLNLEANQEEYRERQREMAQATPKTVKKKKKKPAPAPEPDQESAQEIVTLENAVPQDTTAVAAPQQTAAATSSDMPAGGSPDSSPAAVAGDTATESQTASAVQPPKTDRNAGDDGSLPGTQGGAA